MDVASFARQIRAPVWAAGRRALASRLEHAPAFDLCLRIARFLAVGLVGLAIDTAIFWILFRQGVTPAVARAMSLSFATLATWLLNRLVTFAPSGRAAHHELLRYVGVALAAQGFNYVLFLSLLRWVSQAHPLASLVASAIATASLSFTGQSLVAFRRVPRAA